MLMKTFTFFVSFLFAAAVLQAQDYLISFTGSGQSTSVDSVQVENLTQGTTLSLDGNDVLHLLGTVGINAPTDNESNVKIYPNPMVESTFVEFTNLKTELVCLEIFNEMGILFAKHNKLVQQGRQRFEISGLNAGIYTVNVSTADWKYAAKLISLGKSSGNTAIEHQGTDGGSSPENALKSTKNIIEMQYYDGEILLFACFSENYTIIFTLVPTQSQTVNSEFISCSDEDGNNYAVVTIGDQIWMAENLNYETANSWWYDNNSTNGDVYGRLYTWDAALTACPGGWHLPSDAEWKTLEMYLGMSQSEADAIDWRGTDEGGKLKEAGTGHWDAPNTGATNSSGFSALPGGYRVASGGFGNLSNGGHWWSATEYSSPYAWNRSLFYLMGKVMRYYASKESSYSVRCLKD